MIKTKWKNVAIVNINYRLASNTKNIHHDEIMKDIADAIEHVRNRTGVYNISMKTSIMGASAGAQLAMIYAYRYDDDILCVGNIFGPNNLRDWGWYNSTNPLLGGYVGDIIAEYVGQPWDTTVYTSVSPYWNVDNHTQPTITFHGTYDPIVPVYQSQWFQSRLSSYGVAKEYYEYPAFHSFDGTQAQDVINKLIAFLKKHLN